MMAMKRQNDFLNSSSNLPVEKEPKQFYKIQKPSFKLFQQKETTHMKSIYPFLTKAQINSKVRELWKNLSEEEQQKYSKVVLSKTPVKSPTGLKKKTNRAKDNPRRTKCSIWLDNETEIMSSHHNIKLSCPQRKELPAKTSYQSDFSSPQLIVKKESPTWFRESPVSKDYTRNKNPLDFVPEVIDETPTKQLGILKPTNNQDLQKGLDKSTEKKRQRVSFSPEKIEDESDSCPLEESQGSSCSEDITLIRRNQNDVCNFDDIENYSMCIETDEPPTGQTKPELKCINDSGHDFNDKKFWEDECHSHTKMEEDKKTSHKVSNNSKKQEKANISKQTRNKKSRNKPAEKKTTPEIHSKKILRSTPMVPPSNLDQVTPMMDDATIKHLVEMAKQAPKKRQSWNGKTKDDDLNTAADDDVHKKHIRTSLISMKVETEEDNVKIDPSGDAKNFKESNNQMINDSFDVLSEKSEDVLDLDEDDNLLGEDLPPLSSVGSYFKVPEIIPDIELSESDSSEFGALEACKLTSNDTVMETLKRMKEATQIPKTPVDSPTASPKILSPALSGISQLSSASSDSKGIVSEPVSPLPDQNVKVLKESDKEKEKEVKSGIKGHHYYKKYDVKNSSLKNKENISSLQDQNDLLTDVCTTSSKQNASEDETKPAKRTIRFAKRKAPTALQELGKGADKTLCELFYDLTPPGEKQAKTSHRRLLKSSVTPGKSNFSSLFENQTIF